MEPSTAQHFSFAIISFTWMYITMHKKAFDHYFQWITTLNVLIFLVCKKVLPIIISFITVCSTTSSNMFSTRMKREKSSKMSSWKRGSSCQNNIMTLNIFRVVLDWIMHYCYTRAKTYSRAWWGELFQHVRDENLQKSLSEELLTNCAAVVVKFLDIKV